jgi:hypothetical protein
VARGRAASAPGGGCQRGLEEGARAQACLPDTVALSRRVWSERQRQLERLTRLVRKRMAPPRVHLRVGRGEMTTSWAAQTGQRSTKPWSVSRVSQPTDRMPERTNGSSDGNQGAKRWRKAMPIKAGSSAGIKRPIAREDLRAKNIQGIILSSKEHNGSSGYSD